MLNHITWEHFIAATCAMTATYYLAIGYIHYRKRLAGLFARPVEPMDGGPPGTGPEGTVTLTEPQVADAFREMDGINRDIRGKIFPAVAKSRDRKELVRLLSARLESFSGAGEPVFRSVLEDSIQREALKKGIPLNGGDMKALWQGMYQTEFHNNNNNTPDRT